MSEVLTGKKLRAQQIEQLAATREGVCEIEKHRDSLQEAAKQETAELNEYRHAARRLEVALGLAPGADLPEPEAATSEDTGGEDTLQPGDENYGE